MIIAGFAGIGKSAVAKTIPNIVDLESTPFNKNWDIYTDVAKHMSDNGHTVLISCHEELRKTLQDKNIPYLCILPKPSLKEEYVKRYKTRGNKKDFIKSIESNWKNYTTQLPNEFVFRLNESEYLYDIVWALPKLEEEMKKFYKLKECVEGGTVTSGAFEGQTPENFKKEVKEFLKERIFKD